MKSRIQESEQERNGGNLESETTNPLAQTFTLSSLLRFAFPSMLMMLVMGAYAITDTIFVSRFAGTNALSALNIVCPVVNLTVGLGTMLAAGGSAVIAKEMGEGKADRANRDFTLIIATGAGFGILFAAGGILFLDHLIRFLGSSPILFPYCRSYLSTLLLFTPASMLQVLFQNLIVTAGRPGFGMILSIGAGAVNLVLDYLFMVPFGMGIRGAALGTGLGYMIPAILGIVFFLSTKGNLKFSRFKASEQDSWRVRIPGAIHLLSRSCANGFSELVSQGAAAVSTFLFNITMMKLLGEAGVAAITILIYTQFFLTALYIGFSMGVAPIISYAYGSQNTSGLKGIFRLCLFFISLFSLLMFAGTIAFAEPLVSIFSPEGTPVYKIAVKGFMIFPFSFLFCGINIFTSAAFTALSRGVMSAVISTLRTFGFIAPSLLLLPAFLGETGVWIAVPLAEGLTMGISVLLFARERKRYDDL